MPRRAKDFYSAPRIFIFTTRKSQNFRCQRSIRGKVESSRKSSMEKRKWQKFLWHYEIKFLYPSPRKNEKKKAPFLLISMLSFFRYKSLQNGGLRTAAVKYNLNCITTLVWTLSRLDWLSLERTWGQRLQFVTTKGKCSKKINLKIAWKP